MGPKLKCYLFITLKQTYFVKLKLWHSETLFSYYLFIVLYFKAFFLQMKSSAYTPSMDYDFFLPQLLTSCFLAWLITCSFPGSGCWLENRRRKIEGQALLIYLFSSRGETLLDLTSSVIEHSGFIVFSSVSTFSCYHSIHAFIHV